MSRRRFGLFCPLLLLEACRCGSYAGNDLLHSSSPDGKTRVVIRIFQPCTEYERVGVFVGRGTGQPAPLREVHLGPARGDFSLAFLVVAWREDSSAFAVAYRNYLGSDEHIAGFLADGTPMPTGKNLIGEFGKQIDAAIEKEYGAAIPKSANPWQWSATQAAKHLFGGRYMGPWLRSLKTARK